MITKTKDLVKIEFSPKGAKPGYGVIQVAEGPSQIGFHVGKLQKIGRVTQRRTNEKSEHIIDFNFSLKDAKEFEQALYNAFYSLEDGDAECTITWEYSTLLVFKDKRSVNVLLNIIRGIKMRCFGDESFYQYTAA